MEASIQQTIEEVIKKQIIILGPYIAVLKAREIEGLEISDEGKVISLKADPLQILQNLVDKYVSLSGLIIKKAMEPLLNKHINLKGDI